ncbi:FAD-binding domain-containing protein [Hypoxylon trugodes]|uniref:FAD-binding domain-containing protein n=1 Tax=Hypoxylon trugodes TaxID=326681 RepID=UPI00219EFC02|nr:FAD-binding domain-containing protein [Hypoxylon trugodes]KAI1385796.1 FAD-binding domain-containing protein [Hypoxylon trugodes]
MKKPTLSFIYLGAFLTGAVAFSKPRALVSDSVQLTQDDIGDFAAINFGDETAASPADANVPGCKIFPGDEDWPSDTEWTRLNRTLGGALLKPKPAAAVCYQGADFNQDQCQLLLRNTSFSTFWLDEPLVSLTEWSQGGTCPLALNPQGNCTRGGFPEYVVNATSVKHIQAAVNFARNKHIRLVIKNTGHDFGGRSVGAGSLSIWTHHLKEMEFIPSYRVGPYRGKAVQLGAGVQSWEAHNLMAAYNVTVVSPGFGTVGAVGGWMSSGGHTYIVSKYGLGADQVLSLGVVTAAGRYVTADPYTNSDLFFALRGGGGGTYGVVTSAIFKAYPPVNMTPSALNLMLSPQPPPNTTMPIPGLITNAEKFWQGVGAYYRFAAKVLDAGGYGFSYIYPMPNNSYMFTTTSQFPAFTQAEVFEFMKPLYTDLNRIGINVTNPAILFTMPYGLPGRGSGSPPSNTRYRSRLLPRENWEDDDLWNQTMKAIRTATEAGFENNFYFHGTLASPTAEAAGWPGSQSAVNPAWRNNRMHAMLMDQTPLQSTDRDTLMQGYMDLLRGVSPNAGSYMNEGDPGEPNWQQAFYGSHYPRLLRIKRSRDPWGLFWAPTTVGSEGWAVRPADGVYAGSQNGRLCRTRGVDE